MRNLQKGFVGGLLLIVIVILLIGGRMYLYEGNKKASQPIVENSGTLATSTIQTSSNQIRPQDYSLVEYPLNQSPIYGQIDKQCYGPYWVDAIDARIVKSGSEVIIPSLLQFISSKEGTKLSCGIMAGFEIFYAPADGKYLYLKIHPFTYGLAEDKIYRLDLSDLSVMSMSNNRISMGEYQLLLGGKKLIKWTSKTVYLINMETNISTALYTVSKNQSLISSIVDNGAMDYAKYDVKVDGMNIVIGVYDETKTQDGNAIIPYQIGAFNMKYLDRVTIPILDL